MDTHTWAGAGESQHLTVRRDQSQVYVKPTDTSNYHHHQQHTTPQRSTAQHRLMQSVYTNRWVMMDVCTSVCLSVSAPFPLTASHQPTATGRQKQQCLLDCYSRRLETGRERT
mmetsp:Transcript_44227/g.125113  ORF Transcript_44227/g.125113 Transcript_44227/m.125113 type:complete len:113 (+) Transcript_44227:548-886(+)